MPIGFRPIVARRIALSEHAEQRERRLEPYRSEWRQRTLLLHCKSLVKILVLPPTGPLLLALAGFGGRDPPPAPRPMDRVRRRRAAARARDARRRGLPRPLHRHHACFRSDASRRTRRRSSSSAAARGAMPRIRRSDAVDAGSRARALRREARADLTGLPVLVSGGRGREERPGRGAARCATC